MDDPMIRDRVTRLTFRAAPLMAMLAAGCAPVTAVEAQDLQAAQQAIHDGRPAAALDVLGEPDSAAPASAEERERLVIAATLRGQALVELDRLDDARQAYAHALALDQGAQPAAEGLIHCLRQAEDWAALQALVDRWALQADSRPELVLIALEAARERADALLALHLAQLGVARFPLDRRFRIAQAQALSEAGQDGPAQQAWETLTRAEPQDASWWRALAGAHQRQDDPVAARQALAVAHAADPDDSTVAQDRLVSLLAAGHDAAALTLARELVAADEVDPGTILLGVRAAWLADEPQLAQSWLFSLPETRRDVDWQRWSLQLAMQAGDQAAARQAAEALIRQGAGDARIRLHAARLAAAGDDLVAAESHLRVVLADDDPALIHLARLHLVHLLVERDRLDEAETLIRAAVAARPTDVAANRLAAVVQRGRLHEARHTGDDL